MKKIIFVTSNKGKYLSAKNFLEKFKISVIQKNLEIPESRGSIKNIAIQKAQYAYKILKKPVIAMDAGFFCSFFKWIPKDVYKFRS
jgi:inosine/xanthosine triphosphate pyrophosphatase family protein